MLVDSVMMLVLLYKLEVLLSVVNLEGDLIMMVMIVLQHVE